MPSSPLNSLRGAVKIGVVILEGKIAVEPSMFSNADIQDSTFERPRP